MKKLISLLVAAMVLMTCAGCHNEPPVSTPGTQPSTSLQTTAPTTTVPETTVPETTVPPVIDYANSTVILYTANVRGQVEVYSAIAAARADYEALGATVILVDAGNYLQGTAYANSDMGLSIYMLMEAAGYDVAGLGVYDLAHGEAEVGYAPHGDLVKYYTQAQLYRGTYQLPYQQNAAWDREPVMAIRPGKAAAAFSVICSNLAKGENTTGYYDFDASVVLGDGLQVGFVCAMPENALDYVGDNFLYGYTYTEILAPECDILVTMGSDQGDIVLDAGTDGSFQVGAWIIDHQSLRTFHESVALTGRDSQVDALIATLEKAEVIGLCTQTLSGSALVNYCPDAPMGALVADALKWYAETYMEGLEHPVIGLQSGANCRNFLYNGEITKTDLENAIHASTAGVAVVYVTGAQLLEVLESATQRAYCPGWAHVSGIDYAVDTTKAYDAGAIYGHYYKAASINRVSITTEGFDPEQRYAVVADQMLLRGGDTYYTFLDCEIVAYAQDGLDVCDIVALYLQQALGGNLN